MNNTCRFVAIVGMLFSWMAASHSVGNGGVIYFSGALVEGPCAISITDSTTNTRCYRDGRYYRSRQYIWSKVGTTRKELPLHLGTTEMRWLDQQHKLAVMTVAYR